MRIFALQVLMGLLLVLAPSGSSGEEGAGVGAKKEEGGKPAAGGAEANPAGGGGELKTLVEKYSYILGRQIGTQFRNDKLEIDQKRFLQGIDEGAQGAKSLLSEEQIEEAMKSLQEKLDKQSQASAEEGLQKGKDFLEKNRQAKGVVTTLSGLQYLELREGTGASPKDEDWVTVQYKGSLLDGTEFDSSYARGKPAAFQVNRVIPGWTEALKRMKTGAKWKLFIPSSLGYGPRGAPPEIPPHATLVFEVELMEIKGPAKQPEIKIPEEDDGKK
jgi:FKBP-type peptidyl-prolyl cis-trans isomerase